MRRAVAALLLPLLVAWAPAQESERSLVPNGDFETGSYSHGWTLFGGNVYTEMAKFQTSITGSPSWALKRRPGTPSSNGGLQTDVPLTGGETYTFNAWVAAQYCSS